MSAIGSAESGSYQVLYYKHKVRTKRRNVRAVGGNIWAQYWSLTDTCAWWSLKYFASSRKYINPLKSEISQHYI